MVGSPSTSTIFSALKTAIPCAAAAGKSGSHGTRLSPAMMRFSQSRQAVLHDRPALAAGAALRRVVAVPVFRAVVAALRLRVAGFFSVSLAIVHNQFGG